MTVLGDGLGVTAGDSVGVGGRGMVGVGTSLAWLAGEEGLPGAGLVIELPYGDGLTEGLLGGLLIGDTSSGALATGG